MELKLLSCIRRSNNFVFLYPQKIYLFMSPRMDFDKNFLNIKNTIPKLTVMAQYDMKGRILVLPIEGNGNCNITYRKSRSTSKVHISTLFRQPVKCEKKNIFYTESQYFLATPCIKLLT